MLLFKGSAFAEFSGRTSGSMFNTDTMKLFLFFSFLLSILFYGCKKNSETNCIENYNGLITISPKEKLIHPYGLHDSLIFQDNTFTNKLTFICDKQDTWFDIATKSQWDEHHHIICLGEYYKTEVYTTSFYQKNANVYGFYISEYAKNPFDSIQGKSILSIVIDLHIDTIQSFVGYYKFAADTLFTYTIPVFPSYIEYFYDTLIVSGKTYFKVYSLVGGIGTSREERIIKVLYSVSDGIIKFSTNQNRYWELKEKYIIH
jgi:hypothetical protein